MCGIVFLISEKPVQEETLAAMRDTLIHRGPNGFGQLIEKNRAEYHVGLAHRRLSILDLSENGKQPMENPMNNTVITYNGEIYNYIEIREELKNIGYEFATQTDTEVLLKSYEAWGTDCLKKLNGMFAFVIWDRKNQVAFVARDRFGEKPLYYATLPGKGVIFASEIKAILAHPEISFSPCDITMLNYISHSENIYEENKTFYKGIVKFPIASAALLDNQGHIKTIFSYWQPNLQVKENFDRKRTDVYEKFLYLFKKSITLRMRADVSLGMCLSGGLDSSAICSLMPELISEKRVLESLNSYSVRFDSDPTISEGEYIDCVLDKTGLKNIAVSPDESNLLSDIEKLYWHQEEPFLSSSMFLEYKLYEAIKQNNTPVILDGQGADELFGGYQNYFRLFQLDLLQSGSFLNLAKDTYCFNKRLLNESKKYVDSKRRFNHKIAYNFFELIAVYFKRRMSKQNSIKNITAQGYFRGMIEYNIRSRSLPAQLHSADRNSMAFSIETRFPFLDYELVDYCLSLDTQYFMHEGWTKYILRRSLQGILPKKVQWRAHKVGFAPPQDVWLRQGLKEWAYHHLFEGNLSHFPQFSFEKTKQMWDKHQRASHDYSWELWRWISLNQWLEANTQKKVLWKHVLPVSQ